MRRDGWTFCGQYFLRPRDGRSGLTQHRSSVQLGRRAPLWQHVAPSNDVSLFCSPPHTPPPHEVHHGSPQPGVTPPGRMRHPVPQIQTSNESNCLRTDGAHGKRALRCDCAGCSEGPRPWLPATPIANLVATPTGCVQSSTGNMHTTQKQKVVVPGSGHTRKQICIALACTHNLHTSVAAAPGATSFYPLWLRPGQLLPVARLPLRQPGSSGSAPAHRGGAHPYSSLLIQALVSFTGCTWLRACQARFASISASRQARQQQL